MTSQAAPEKPRLRIVDETYARVTYRGLEGSVSAESAHSWRSTYWPAGATSGNTVSTHSYDAASALRQLVARLDEIADCRALLVEADRFSERGGLDRLHKLAGEPCVAAFTAALFKLQAEDIDGAVTVRGLMKAASKKRLPKSTSMILPPSYSGAESHAVTLIPGVMITVKSSKCEDSFTFFIGQSAEYGSYNLHYFGTITSITAKTVTIDRGSDKSQKRLKLDHFAWRNDSDKAAKVRRNAAWCD